jgi:septal ring factor EnvC (AmiA/AmiB activator)
MAVGGAVTRTLWYQYQISALSAEMLDASELRQNNMARLDSVRKEMAGLSDQFNKLKERNSGLRKERDRDKERLDAAEGERKSLDGTRTEDMLDAEEMGNI